MPDYSANNKRIAKNTILLYFRMLLTMLVSLYTSRVVLATLGETDYGLYNVVGGVVAMFGFLNAAMITSSQRYITFALGQGNLKNLKNVFSTSIQIHALIAIVIVILAETAGLWFLQNEMTIPAERVNAAQWVYHLSVLGMVVVIMGVPFNASIVAHEKMSAFAYVSILEVILKLLIVYILYIGNIDKLKLYAILMFLVQLCICLIYIIYCLRHFSETRCVHYRNKSLFKEMLSFAGWNLVGNGAAVAFTQGLNILLNVFFTPAINAARAVAVQVQGAVAMFSSNFQVAVNPQITKSFAVGNLDYMHNLVFRTSKFTFILLFCLSLPIILETEIILDIWLKEVPEFTVSFLRLMLCVTIIDAMAGPLMTSAAASGRVKVYQSVVGGILLMILPISYIVLKLGGNPTSVFIVHLCICCVAFIVRLFIIRPLIQLSIRQFVGEVIVRCCLVAIISSIIPVLLRIVLPQNILSFIIVCCFSVLSIGLVSYKIGLNVSERMFIKNKIISLFAKLKR